MKHSLENVVQCGEAAEDEEAWQEEVEGPREEGSSIARIQGARWKAKRLLAIFGCLVLTALAVILPISVSSYKNKDSKPSSSAGKDTPLTSEAPTRVPSRADVSSTNAPTSPLTTPPSLLPETFSPTILPTSNQLTQSPTEASSNMPTWALPAAMEQGLTFLSSLSTVAPYLDWSAMRDPTTRHYQALEWLTMKDAYNYTAALHKQENKKDQARMLESWNETSSAAIEASFFERFVIALLYFSLNGTEWPSRSNVLTNSSICDWNGVSCVLQNSTRHLLQISLMGSVKAPLVGKIPTEVFLLTNLGHLVASLTSIDFGASLPGHLLGRLPHLSSLRLENWNSDMVSSIPTEIGLLNHSLISLEFTGSAFGGSLPTELGRLRRLMSLELHGVSMEGTFPTEMGQLTSLSSLEITGTHEVLWLCDGQRLCDPSVQGVATRKDHQINITGSFRKKLATGHASKGYSSKMFSYQEPFLQKLVKC